MKTTLAKIWRILHLPKDVQLSVMRVTQDQFLVGVTGVIFNDQDEVLLFKHTYRQTEWSLPGGYIKGKEHPQEALEREIEEETDLIVSADHQLKLRTDRETARLDICFMGSFFGGNFKPSAEVSEIGFFPFDKLPSISKNQLLLIKQALHQRKLLQKKNNQPLGFFRKMLGYN